MSDYRFEYLEPRDRPAGRSGPVATLARGCGRLVLILAQLTLLALVGLAVALGAGYAYLSQDLAGAIERVVAYQGQGPGGTPRYFDRHGNLLFEVTTVEKRRWLDYHEIPDNVKLATVAIEDDTFWTNPGFDPAAIGAALLSNYRQDPERPIGASTITQQLVRSIAFSYDERIAPSYERKIREIFLAAILTRQRHKIDILTMYLNEVYYGNLAYGIEAAAQTYFGKPAASLSLAEAALLAGLVQAPARLDPYTDPEAARARQALVLELMLEDGSVSQDAFRQAQAEPLRFAPLITPNEAAGEKTLEAPHFVLYIQQELERRYGPDAITRGGWQITTSLDLPLQHMAEAAARNWIAGRAAVHDVNNAAVVVLKPGTGEILSLVGSLDYFNAAIDGQVNVALQPRQPGSSIKPVTYAAALESGWTTGDVLWDVPIVLDLGDGQKMQPVNYDGRYHGPLLLRDALANSYNVPPVVLMRDIGIGTMIATGRRMGIDSLRQPPGFYGLALTLGGGEVQLLELTRAFGTLANGGRRPQLIGVLRIVDGRGNVVFDAHNQRVPAANALTPQVAYILTDILDDDVARRPAFGFNNDLALPFPAAVKTGTTTDFRDNWTVGYTPGVVVGVWVGNTDGHPMRESSGLRGAAPLWRQILETIYNQPALFQTLYVDGQPPPREFPRPPNIEERAVCLPRATGGERCGATRPDLFIVGGPVSGIPRLGYVPDKRTVPGAWQLSVVPLSGLEAEGISQSPLDDGTRPPPPRYCVLNTARGSDSAQLRLFLPVPSYYPDEVRARLWAERYGYEMAPPAACPVTVARAAAAGGTPGSTVEFSGGYTTGGSRGGLVGGSAGGGFQALISSPRPGETVSGVVSVLGTAAFGPDHQYYKLEIGQGVNPAEWTTFGTTHSQPVQNGVLEALHAYALPAGDYVIRLVIVRQDGNFATPYTVPIRVSP